MRSCYNKIGEYLGIKNASEKLWNYLEDGKKAIDAYLTEIGEENKKVGCLRTYRDQMPHIEPYEGVIEMIQALKVKGKVVKAGIITDGRPEGQRNNIKALGLDKLIEDIIITDELGGTQFRKTCNIAFRIMQNR